MKKKGIIEFIEEIFSFAEKERFNLPSISAIIFLIILIRTIIEGNLSPSWSWDPMFNISAISFYIPQFLGMVLVLKIFTKQKTRKLLNLSCLGFPVIIFPPIYDFIILKRTQNYSYIPVERIPEMITSFYLKLPSQFPWMGDGMILQFIFIFFAVTLYVLVKTKSVLKAASFFTLLYFSGPFLVTPRIDPLVGSLHMYPNSTSVSIVYFFHFILTAFFIGIFIVLLEYKKKTIYIIKSMNIFTTTHFLLMSIIGAIVAGNIGRDLLHIPIYPETAIVGIMLFANFFLWQHTIWVNHLYDIEIDKLSNKERALPSNVIDVAKAKEIIILFAIFSLSLSFILGIDVFISLLGIFLSFLYSSPPFRLRNRIIAPIFVGAGSLMAFLFGVFLPSPQDLKRIPYLGIHPIDSLIISISVLIFIIFSITPVIRQLKDYEGDKKAGVKTIFTIYGKEKGISIASFLLIFAVSSPLIIFHKLIDLFVFVPCGILSGILFKKTKNARAIFVIYFFIILYSLIRWLMNAYF